MQHCSFSQINLQTEVISIYLFISCEKTIWHWLLTEEEGLFENDMKNKICRDNIDVHWRPWCRGVVFLFRPKFCWRIFKRPKKVPEFSWLCTNYPVWKVSIIFTDSCENEHSSWSGKTSYCVHLNTALEPGSGLLINLLNWSKLCHDNICPASVTNIILNTWLSRETNPVIDPRLGVVWWGGQNSAQREVWERPYSEEGTSALSALSRLQDPADKQPELVEMPFSAKLYNLYISEETLNKHCFFGVFKSILIYCSGLYPISGWLDYQARARSEWARRACALRALGFLLADGAPTVGVGKTFWRVN